MLKVTLKRIDVVSVAKWHGLTGLTSGFLAGSIYFAIASYTSAQAAMRYGYYYFIVIPLVYFVVTIAGSIVVGTLYNILSGTLGEMKFEIEADAKEENPPPAPPKSWDDETSLNK